jgi:hypothetical protein
MSPETLILPASILGAVTTYWLNHDLRVGAIRASTGATLVFVVLTLPLPQAWLPMLRASFFGATFVGMATTDRFTRRQVAAGAIIYGLLYMLILRAPSMTREPGGLLGTSAFLAGVLVAGFDWLWSKLSERSPATEAAIPPR